MADDREEQAFGRHGRRRGARILHVFGRMSRGGAELRTLELMRVIDRTRYELGFCTLSGLPGELDPEIRRLGGEVHPCRLDATFPVRFVALLRRLRPDVVHSHVFLTSGLVLRLARLGGVPARIAHFRTMGDGRSPTLRRRGQRALMRYWLDRHSDRLVSVSKGAMVAAWGSQWRRDPRCRVIYAGFDPSRFEGLASPEKVRASLGLESAHPVCIHVGSMQAAKNHVRVVDVFARLAEQEPSASLVLVGRRDASIEQDVLGRTRRHGLGDRVKILGEREDVLDLLRAADVMLFPSVREGLPGAVVEACGVGTPVVASDLPGLKEIAQHLPGVVCLPLSKSDDFWTAAAVELMRDARARRPRTALLARTVFDVHESAAAHCRLWDEVTR
jgi:glycosyltransferase involved in cell wall biosynthesis